MHSAKHFLMISVAGACLAGLSLHADDDAKGATLHQAPVGTDETKPAKPAETKTTAQAEPAKAAPTTNTPPTSVTATNAPAKKMNPKQPMTFPPMPAPPNPLSAEKKQQLDDLLAQYKTDKISAEEYHKKRAEILKGN